MNLALDLNLILSRNNECCGDLVQIDVRKLILNFSNKQCTNKQGQRKFNVCQHPSYLSADAT